MLAWAARNFTGGEEQGVGRGRGGEGERKEKSEDGYSVVGETAPEPTHT